MINRLIYIISIIITFYSCSNKENVVEFEEEKNEIGDTIFPPKNLSIEDTCFSYLQGYRNKFGLTISNFFKQEIVLIYDFNKDNEMDSIITLFPFYTLDDELDNYCYLNDESASPILLFCKVKRGKIMNVQIFKELLDFKSWSLGGQYIEPNENNQLCIFGDWGHSNKFYSTLYLNYYNNRVIIDSINIESYFKFQYNKTYKLTIEAKQFRNSIVDSLRHLNERLGSGIK